MSDSVRRLTGVLPFLTQCERITLSVGDVVIHAPGFEDRTGALAQIAVASGDVRAILLKYSPPDARNRFEEIIEAFNRLGIEVDSDDTIVYDRFDPRDYEARLRQALERKPLLRVVLDISTMSKLAIFLTLKVCRELNLVVHVFYAEARSYAPSRDEFETAKLKNEIHRPTLQIFSGIHGVVRVASLASVAMQGQPTAAIVFMSFNDALTQVLLNTIYPSRLFLINGQPPIYSWREAATAWIHDEVRREWKEDNPLVVEQETGEFVPSRSASTLDYRETVSILLDLYWDLSREHRIVLAPSGSKMQTVGCFLVWALHPDIHIEYPSPDGFMPEYSSGVGHCWYLELGNVQALISELFGRERREFVELPTGDNPPDA